MIERKKQDAFAMIFKWLDSDSDGFISPMKIDISMIDTDLLEVLSPLLIELEEINQPLDEGEFGDALSRLYDCSTLPHKEILLLKDLSLKRKNDGYKECTFKVSLKSFFVTNF
jgi:hypothetical protein